MQYAIATHFLEFRFQRILERVQDLKSVGDPTLITLSYLPTGCVHICACYACLTPTVLLLLTWFDGLQRVTNCNAIGRLVAS